MVVALPAFIALGLPLIGWLVVAVVWSAQRGIEVAIRRKADASKDPRLIVGLTMGGAIGRGWLVALSVLALGITNESAGLAAVLLVMLLFTVAFVTRLITRPFEAAKS
jgi:hypothetical protein